MQGRRKSSILHVGTSIHQSIDPSNSIFAHHMLKGQCSEARSHFPYLPHACGRNLLQMKLWWSHRLCVWASLIAIVWGIILKPFCHGEEKTIKTMHLLICFAFKCILQLFSLPGELISGCQQSTFRKFSGQALLYMQKVSGCISR